MSLKSNPSHALNLICHKSQDLFKSSPDYIRSTEDNLPFLKVDWFGILITSTKFLHSST